MTKRQILGKSVMKGLTKGATIRMSPLLILALGGLSKSRRSIGGFLLSALLCIISVIPTLLLTAVAVVVGALIGLAVGTVKAITRRPLGNNESHQLKVDVEQFLANDSNAEIFIRLLRKKYEERRKPLSKNSRDILNLIKTSGPNSKAAMLNYVRDEENNGKRMYRHIHDLINDGKKCAATANKVKVNAKILAQGKRSPDSPLSKLPAELLVNIAMFARPEAMDPNVAQTTAQEVIRRVQS